MPFVSGIVFDNSLFLLFDVVSVGIMNYSIFEYVNVSVINVLCDVEAVCSHCRSFEIMHHSQ